MHWLCEAYDFFRWMNYNPPGGPHIDGYKPRACRHKRAKEHG